MPANHANIANAKTMTSEILAREGGSRKGAKFAKGDRRASVLKRRPKGTKG